MLIFSADDNGGCSSSRCSIGCGVGAPMLVRVINPAGQMSIMAVGADAPVPVGQPVVAIINTQSVALNPADIDATAKGMSNGVAHIPL